MKKALIAGAVLLALGVILCLGGFAAMGFDISKFFSVTYTTHTFIPEGDFSDISVTGETCDIRFAKSEDGTCKIICTVENRCVPTAEIKDGKLTIHVDDNLKWWHRIGIHWDKNEVTVYLPETEYSKLEAKTTTGDIFLNSGFTFADATLKTTTGDIQVSSLSCKYFRATVTTGDMEFRDVLTETMTLTATTGDIEFSRCDGKTIDIRCTTGDVEGTLRTGKLFTAKATTGDVRVPSDSGSDTCYIKTTTGDIEIAVE